MTPAEKRAAVLAAAAELRDNPEWWVAFTPDPQPSRPRCLYWHLVGPGNREQSPLTDAGFVFRELSGIIDAGEGATSAADMYRRAVELCDRFWPEPVVDDTYPETLEALDAKIEEATRGVVRCLDEIALANLAPPQPAVPEPKPQPQHAVMFSDKPKSRNRLRAWGWVVVLFLLVQFPVFAMCSPALGDDGRRVPAVTDTNVLACTNVPTHNRLFKARRAR